MHSNEKNMKEFLQHHSVDMSDINRTEFRKLSNELREFLNSNIELIEIIENNGCFRSFAHGLISEFSPKKKRLKWIAELENITDCWEVENGIRLSHFDFEKFSNNDLYD